MFDLYAEVRDLARSEPARAHQRWREARDDLFARHPSSALRAADRPGFRGLRYFAYDPRLRFSAPLTGEAESEKLEVASSTGEAMWLRRIGQVALPIGTLPVFWIEVYGGGLFIPFRDATSGGSTYGGGRYLLDTVKGADLGSTDEGELVLDLNFAYHPSCHYNERWSCPLAGPESRLAVAVGAGEMAWSSEG